LSWTHNYGLDPDFVLQDYIKRTNKDFKIDFTDHLKQVNNQEIENDDILDSVSGQQSVSLVCDSHDKINIRASIDLSIRKRFELSKKCHYGSIYLLNQLCKNSGLDDILSKVFLDEVLKIKSLVYFNILDHRPLMYCKDFVNNYDIPINQSELAS
jgi:hypothetical protein